MLQNRRSQSILAFASQTLRGNERGWNRIMSSEHQNGIVNGNGTMTNQALRASENGNGTMTNQALRASENGNGTMTNQALRASVNGNGAMTNQALRASELSYRRLFETDKDGVLDWKS